MRVGETYPLWLRVVREEVEASHAAEALYEAVVAFRRALQSLNLLQLGSNNRVLRQELLEVMPLQEVILVLFVLKQNEQKPRIVSLF